MENVFGQVKRLSSKTQRTFLRKQLLEATFPSGINGSPDFTKFTRDLCEQRSECLRVIRAARFMERAICGKGVSAQRHSVPFDAAVALVLFLSRFLCQPTKG